MDMNRHADDQVETLQQALQTNNKGTPSPLARDPAH